MRRLPLLIIVSALALPTIALWAQQKVIQSVEQNASQGSILLNDKEPLTEEDYIGSLTPERRIDYCSNSFENGLYVDHPDCWKSVKNASAVLNGVLAYNEPITAVRLDALERVFPVLLVEEERKQAGFLLYRYNRQSGRQYLAKRLQDRLDTAAAQTLAMNHEAKYLPLILKSLSKNQAPEVVEALGKWQTPEVTKSLHDAFRLALLKKDGDANFPIPLSLHNSKKSIPLIQKLNKSLSFDDGPAKYNTCAALIRLESPGSAGLMKLFVDSLADNQTKLSKVYIIRALGVTAKPQAINALLQVIKKFVDKGSAPIWENNGQEHADELAVEAAEALVSVKSPATVNLVSKQLLRFKKDRRSLVDYWERTAKALIDLGGGRAGTEKAVVEVMGKEWLKKALLKRDLKWIPAAWSLKEAWDPEQVTGRP